MKALFTMRLSGDLFLVALILTQTTAIALAEKHTYSLTGDWSDTQNPNGVWSYNYNNAPIGTYQPFWWGETGWGDLWLADGAILKGDYPTGVDPWGNAISPPHDWQTNDVMMHALSEPYGGLSAFLNVTWTSPAAGKIDITGRAWEGEIFADRDVAWMLMVNGEVFAQRESVQDLYRTDASAQFSANLIDGHSLKNIPVAEGDVVEFRVIATTYYGHFVGVEANVTLTGPAQPPRKHQPPDTSTYQNETKSPQPVRAD